MTDNVNTTLEVEVKIKTFDLTKGELIDAIASGAKLTKADAGRAAAVNEDTTHVTVESFDTSLGFTFPQIDIEMGYKLSNNSEA